VSSFLRVWIDWHVFVANTFDIIESATICGSYLSLDLLRWFDRTIIAYGRFFSRASSLGKYRSYGVRASSWCASINEISSGSIKLLWSVSTIIIFESSRPVSITSRGLDSLRKSLKKPDYSYSIIIYDRSLSVLLYSGELTKQLFSGGNSLIYATGGKSANSCSLVTSSPKQEIVRDRSLLNMKEGWRFTLWDSFISSRSRSRL